MDYVNSAILICINNQYESCGAESALSNRCFCFIGSGLSMDSFTFIPVKYNKWKANKTHFVVAMGDHVGNGVVANCNLFKVME